MRVTTKAVYDVDGNLLEWQGYQYSGPVELCKGADVANDQRKQELQMQKDAFAQQTQTLNFLKDNFSKYVSGNPVGFDPQQYAAMRSNLLDQNALQYQNAGQGVRQALLARGSGDGTAPVGGDYARGLSSLLGAAAANKALGLQNLDIANAQQGLQNRFNAGSILSGNAQTLSSPQYAASSGASSALGSYIQAKNTGFGASFLNNLGGALGGFAAKAAAGGGGFGLSCWVASELYGGWYEPRTMAVRGWFNTHPVLQAIYSLCGEWWASVIRRHGFARRVTKEVFDWILGRTGYEG